MKLIVLDCDGVLSRGEAQPFDLSLLARLATLNRQARRDNSIPAVTLNTGRPSPYVEAIMQAIEGWQPALYENGAGLYFPQPYRFEITPLLNVEQRAALQEVIRRIDRALVQSKRAYWQPGKSVCYSLFAHPPLSIDDFSAEVSAIAAEVSPHFHVSPAGLALNIHPAEIDKGSGLQWLSKVTHIPLSQMGGVGDSDGDIPFLRQIAHSAAPANAAASVKSVVDYCSSLPDVAGLHDILDHWAVPSQILPKS